MPPSTYLSSRDHSELEARLFLGLRLLLFWAPLPLASNRAWAWSILVVWASLLCLIWLVARWRGRVPSPVAAHFVRWPLVLIAAGIALLFLQWLPLPATAVRQLSPMALHAQQAVSAAPLEVASLSIERFATLQMLLKAVALGAVFWLTVALARRTEHLERLAYTFVYAGLFQALLGIALHMGEASYTVFFESFTHEVAKGSFVNRNHFAAFLNICLAMGIGLMIGKLHVQPLDNWRRRLRWLAAVLLSEKARLRVMLVIMVIGVVLTRSRGGNSAFFIALLVTGAAAVPLLQKTSRAAAWFIASLVVLDVVIIGSWVGVEKVVHRISETSITKAAGTSEESVQERVDPGLKSLASLKDYPLLGSGGGTFYAVFPKYRPVESRGLYDHAHNDYAQLAVETGYLGSILATLALALLLAAAALTLASKQHRSLRRGLAFGGAMATVTLLIHCWTDFNLQIPAIALAAAVVSGMICAGQAVRFKRDVPTTVKQAMPPRELRAAS